MKITLQSHNIFAANRHIQALGKLFGNNVPNPYATYEICLKAEKEAHRMMTKSCNGEISDEKLEKWEEKFLKRLTKNLGVKEMPDGFFINGDPRGYALKMKEGTFEGLSTDFGGYGILGAEF